ncbi:MAG: hypothetical protein ACLQUY_21365 [Ktedonobacterales bacterium]
MRLISWQRASFSHYLSHFFDGWPELQDEIERHLLLGNPQIVWYIKMHQRSPSSS